MISRQYHHIIAKMLKTGIVPNSGGNLASDLIYIRAAEPVPPKGQSRWLLKNIEIQNKINAMRDAPLGPDVRE